MTINPRVFTFSPAHQYLSLGGRLNNWIHGDHKKRVAAFSDLRSPAPKKQKLSQLDAHMQENDLINGWR